jgi:hypothetical protein
VEKFSIAKDNPGVVIPVVPSSVIAIVYAPSKAVIRAVSWVMSWVMRSAVTAPFAIDNDSTLSMAMVLFIEF